MCAPFAGIAFLWFLAVIRDRIGAREDRFLATVFLGSGLLFVAMFWAAAAALASLVAGGALEAAPPLSATTLETFRSLAFSFLFVLAARAAAVFMIVTSTIALRTAIFPRWLDDRELRHRAGDAPQPRGVAVGRVALPGVGVRDERLHPQQRDRRIRLPAWSTPAAEHVDQLQRPLTMVGRPRSVLEGGLDRAVAGPPPPAGHDPGRSARRTPPRSGRWHPRRRCRRRHSPR